MPGIIYSLLIDNAPIPAEMLEAVQEVHVENNAEMADVFRLRFAIGVSDKGDWTILEEDFFKPLTPVSVRMQMNSGLGEPLISGYVTSSSTEISNEPGQSVLEVVGMDATALMNFEEKVIAWPNMADSDIATAIFGNYGFIPQVDRTQPVRQELEVTTIQRGTDIQFLRTLAERNGFECYVENDPMMNADVGHFHPPQLQGKAQGTLSISFSADTNVNSFRARYEMLRPIEAKALGVDIATKSVQQGQAQTVSATNLGGERLHERMSKRPLILSSKTGLANTGELQTLCQALVDRSAMAIIAEGDLNTDAYEGILRAHRTVNVRGAGGLYSGTYYVSKVLHTFSGECYTQHFELRRNAIGLSGSEVFVDTGALG